MTQSRGATPARQAGTWRGLNSAGVCSPMQDHTGSR